MVGCSTVKPGNDPFVVRAEQTVDTAYHTFDLFVVLERENEGIVAQFNVGIHVYAELIRRESPHWINTANTLIRTYKRNRTSDNKANAQTAIAVVEAGLEQAKKYIAEVNSHKN